MSDLTPLKHLPELEWLNADFTSVKILPDGQLSSLRRVSLLHTQISDRAVAAFEKRNPQCIVFRRWEDTLTDLLLRADRIRVRGWARSSAKERTFFEETDLARISTIVGNLTINESASDRIYTCIARYVLEFYEGDRLLKSVGYVCDKSLSWTDGWPPDGTLTAGGVAFLNRWLRRNGVDTTR